MIKLPVFSVFAPEEWTSQDKKNALQFQGVREIISYALGPAGTNIEQAAKLWHAEMGIAEKAKIVLCDLPETALKEALKRHEEGSLAIFWTCAVFKRMHDIFFNAPDTLPLFFSHEMLLDEMQLAVVGGEAEELIRNSKTGSDLSQISIATHVSPAPLLQKFKDFGAQIIDAHSNAEAARMCKAGEVKACITTESARQIHGLKTMHVFGSPLMVFFGGITREGIQLLERAKIESTEALSGFRP